ncbi:hypothetical protein [Seonamhaeicola maritimus]|uniref:Uncharacterized protein n=1 Tax=Seonamhaeicola maritimus TaxID=2591822 RepID=A0A5C7GEN8_9FLAO|nr:hypothetical protein [Seonamhaeicola maritimus]TXG34715.1 hypothetical protein FUA22_17555 [Seonamhaeicola maritimus]
MDFDLVFDVLICVGVLILLIGIVITQKNTTILRTKANSNRNYLYSKLQKAKQENQLLTQKYVLAENLSPVLFTRFFDIIKQILSLQKFIFEESQ